MDTDRARLPAPLLDSVVALMREHLGEPLTVADLADHVGYSRFHFSRLFSAETHLSPATYLAALRFATAKQLLLGSDEPVVDICAEVGFASLSTFGRRFRQAVGVAPGEFRHLADAVSDRPVHPFALGDPRQPVVTISLVLPSAGARQQRSTWVGWYPAPVPIGLPHGGVLVRGDADVRLPLSPGNPWLLGITLDADADASEHLAPTSPTVAAHPAPILTSRSVTLTFGPAAPNAVPLLSALPSLRR